MEQLLQITLTQDNLIANWLLVGRFNGCLKQISSIWVNWTTAREIQIDGNHPTAWNNKCIPPVVYINNTKQYPAFTKFPFAKFIKFKHWDQNLSLPAQAKFHCFPFLHMSHFTSQSLNKYLHCNKTIFVYKVSLASRMHFYVNTSFSHKNKYM